MAEETSHSTKEGIPLGEEFVLSDSSFFTRRGSPSSLPSPAAVRKEGSQQHSGPQFLNRPPVVKFRSLGLLVKYGSLVSAAEAQCLLIVRKFLPTVPVPEVYGWLRDGEQTFIYMELVEGLTLEESWDDLTEEHRTAVCQELADLIATWRALPQRLFDGAPFVGNVVGKPLLDWIFVNTCSPEDGPFDSVSQFHDWFTATFGPNWQKPWKGRSPHLYRSKLPDDVPIVFTHADVNPTNILLAPRKDGEAPRVAAIIDWQQSGWYPAYWEYCKARWAWSRKVGDAWWKTYVPRIMEATPYEGDCYNYWDYFVAARGM